MPAQTNLLPKHSLSSEARSSQPRGTSSLTAQPAASRDDGDRQAHGAVAGRPAPIWLQRLSLLVLVIFCLYLGALVAVLPWWPRVWDQNSLLLTYPKLAALLNNGGVRGIISGIGLLDIWIGLSEAINYRDYRG